MDDYYSTYGDEFSRVFDNGVTDADFDFYNTSAAASSSSTNPAYSLTQPSITPYPTLSHSISGPGHVSVAASAGHPQAAPGSMTHLHTVQPQLQRHDSGLYNSQVPQLPLLQQQQQQQQHHQLRQNEAASVHASNHPPTRAQQSGTDGNHPRAQQQLQHHDTADVTTLHQQRAQQQVQDVPNFGAGPRPAAGYAQQQQETPIQQQQRFSPTQQQHQLTQSQYHNPAPAHGQYIQTQYQQPQQQHHVMATGYPSTGHTTTSYTPAPSIPSHQQQQHPQAAHAQRSPVAEPHGQGQGPGGGPNGYGASVPAASSAQQQQAEPARRSSQSYMYSAMLHQQQQQRMQMAQQQPMAVNVAPQQTQVTPAGSFAPQQQHSQGQMFAQPASYQQLHVQIPSQHSPPQYSAASQAQVQQALHQQAIQRRASYEQQASPQSATHPRVPSQYQYAQAMTPNSRRSSFNQPDIKDQPFTQHLQNYVPSQQQQQPQRPPQQQYVSPSTYASHAHVYEQQQQQRQQQQQQQQQRVQQQDYAYEPSPSYSLGGAMDFPAAMRIVSGSTTGSSTTSATDASPSLAASTSPTIVNTASPQTVTLVEALVKPEPMVMEMPSNPLSANGDMKTNMVYVPAAGMYYATRPQVVQPISAAPSEFTLKSEHSGDHAMTMSVMMTTSDPPPFTRAWGSEAKPPTPPPASPQVESVLEQSTEQQSPAEVYYSPPCHSTRSKRRSSTNVSSTAPVAKKAKMSPDAGEVPVASTSASAAGAYAMQGVEDAGGVPEDDEDDGDGDGEAGEAMDGEWTASGANEPKSRPPPRNRHSSGSSAKTTVAKVKSSANLAALAKLSEDERKYVLIADPFSGAVEANRVFCTECQKWVKLGEGVRFRVRHWAGHCALVHKRTRQESEAIHEQGARDATSAALAPPAPPPTAPSGAGSVGGSSKSSKAKRSKTKSKQTSGGGAARNRAQSDSDDDQPLAVLTQRQKSRATKVGQSPNRAAVEAGSTANAARDDSPLTPMSSPIAPPQGNGRVTHMQQAPAPAPVRAPTMAFSGPDISQYSSNFNQRMLHTYDYNEDAVGSPDF